MRSTARRARGGRDDGAGGVLALALVAATICAALAILPLAGALVVARRASAAADSAALAAADVLLGVVPGDACAWAGRVAAAHRVAIVDCVIEGAEAFVTVRADAGMLPVESSSRAGPPR